MNVQIDGQEFLTVKMAGEKYQRCRSTITIWTRKYDVTTKRVGNAMVVHAEELAKAVETIKFYKAQQLNKTHCLYIRVPEPLNKLIRADAKREGVRYNAILRDILKEHYANRP